MAAPFTVAALPRRAVMGVVNVTPDSFSDGGRFLDPGAAIAHGRLLAEQGASVLDVGGESTRPGAAPVDAAEELRRVLPVVRALTAETTAFVSVDTSKARVAAAALDAGAAIVNDVSAGMRDPDMLAVVAGADAGFVAMHMRATPATMQQEATYSDVVAEVGAHLRARVEAAAAAGIRADATLVDPGIGFAKTAAHNVELLRALPTLAAAAAAPVVVGASRKSFIGSILDGLPADRRDEGTLATTVWCFVHGAALVRVHDVDSSVRAARLLDVMDRATQHGIAA